MARAKYPCRLLSLLILPLCVFLVNVVVILSNHSEWMSSEVHEDPLRLYHNFVRHRLTQNGTNQSAALFQRMKKRMLSEYNECGQEKEPGLLDALQTSKTEEMSTKQCWIPPLQVKSISPTYSVLLSVDNSNENTPYVLFTTLYRIILDSAVSDVQVVVSNFTQKRLAKDVDYGNRILRWANSPQHKIKLIVEDDLWKGWLRVKPISEGVVLLYNVRPQKQANRLNQVWREWQAKPTQLLGVLRNPCRLPVFASPLVIHSGYLCFMHHPLAEPLHQWTARAGYLKSWLATVSWLSRMSDTASSNHETASQEIGKAENVELPDKVSEYLGFQPGSLPSY